MNKNDFYKQLMSEYSFDAEKIRNNAKNGRYAKQKISPLTIGITAAVAVCTVACGTLAMTTLGNRNGVDLVGENSSLSALSYSERIQNAIKQQNEARDSEEIIDIMVTFTAPLAPRQAENIIASYTNGSVPVKTVYLADGSRISGSAEVAAVFNGSNPVSALCIECAGSIMSLLQSDPDVCLVELLSEADLDTITPIDPQEVETLEVSGIDDLPPEQSTTGDTTGSNTVEDPIVIDPLPVETTEITIETEQAETIDRSETAELPESNETITSTDTAETVDSAETTEVPETTETTEQLPAEETAEPSEPVISVTPDVLPDGVTLPVNPESYAYETDYLDADHAYFLSDYVMLVRNDESFGLYSYYGEQEELVEKTECISPKVHWVAENGGKAIISGTNDNGARNKLWLADAYSGRIYDLRADETVMDGTLTDVGYNAETQTLTMLIKEYGTYYTYSAKLSNGTLSYANLIFSTEAKTSLLGSANGCTYLAVSDGSLSQVYAVNNASCEARIIKTYSDNPKFSNNLAFTHGIIAPSDYAVTGSVAIFDASTESFIDTGCFENSVSFGASKHSFKLGDSYYTVSNGTLISAGGINTIAAIDYKKSLSQYYTATATGGSVVISDSIYNAENKAAVLDFGYITSNGDATFRNTVDGALGLNNALALESCRENGMYKPEILFESLNVYYSDNAIKQLVELCDISEHSLRYTNGGLKAISAEDTILVINSSSEDSANGTLYIKAGSFGGKAAYRSVRLGFVRENGSWKVDTIIGK